MKNGASGSVVGAIYITNPTQRQPQRKRCAYAFVASAPFGACAFVVVGALVEDAYLGKLEPSCLAVLAVVVTIVVEVVVEMWVG